MTCINGVFESWALSFAGPYDHGNKEGLGNAKYSCGNYGLG